MNDEKFDTNEIAAVGLSLMGIISVIGWVWYSVKYGQTGGTEIPLSIGSGLGGVITGKALSKLEAQKAEQKKQEECKKGDNDDADK